MQLTIKRLLGALALVTTLGIGVSAQAQQAAPQSNLTPEQMQQIQTLQQQGQQIQQEIAALQEQVLTANPELAERNDAIQEMAMQTMREAGFNPEETLQQMEQLQTEYQTEGVSAERKVELRTLFEQNKTRLQQAQQTAMSAPKVQQARADLRTELLQAMQAADPEFPAMMKALEEVENQMREVLMAAQGGAPAQ